MSLTTTAPTHIYASYDAYLRYMTPAAFAPHVLNQGSTKNAHDHDNTYLGLNDAAGNSALLNGLSGSYYTTDATSKSNAAIVIAAADATSKVAAVKVELLGGAGAAFDTLNEIKTLMDLGDTTLQAAIGALATYSVGDGGLTEKNFTNVLLQKLNNGIDDNIAITQFESTLL